MTQVVTPRTPATRRRAFTLLELLVVFTVIAILIGVVLMIGHKIVAGSKERATQNVLQTLDQAMEAYIQAKGGTAARFPDRFADARKDEFPLADATISPGAGAQSIPSGELAVELLKSEPASATIIQKIPSEFLETVDATSTIGGLTPQKNINGVFSTLQYTRVKDAWGKPIRFVHPSYAGIYGTPANPARTISLRQGGNLINPQIYREWQAVTGTGDTTFTGSGDGGLCAGGRPYFYSIGGDGNPARVEDNIYSVRPTFDAAVKAAGQ
jgi:prepilin-type N-terminal cleavage/methylation domain-containing protein